MSSSEFHERLKSKDLRDFRLGTVATSDHETPLTGDEGGVHGRLCHCGRMCTWDHAHEAGLVDLVDHTLQKLPSLFAAVVVDDTQFLAGRQEPPSIATDSACD